MDGRVWEVEVEVDGSFLYWLGIVTRGLEVAFQYGCFSVENAASCGAEDCVVAEGCELQVEDAAVVCADTPNTDGVAIAKVAVQSRLRAVWLVVVEDYDGVLWC